MRLRLGTHAHRKRVNKLTDEQIVKALECCTTRNDCWGCPRHDSSVNACMELPMREVFDLIKRQKAEIERLKEKYDRARFNLQAVLNERADHSEAIKEFIEWLQENGHINFSSEMRLNLVKEMVGEQDV